MLKPFKHQQALSRLRFSTLPALSASLLSMPALAAPADLQFEPGFIRQSPGQPADAGALALRALAEQRPLAAGRYSLELYLNLSPLGKRDITLDDSRDGQTLAPCLSADLLDEIGVREQHLGARQPGDEGHCIDLPTQLAGASAELDAGKLRLNLSIPQSYLRRDTSGAIAEHHWDEGINAAFVNYQASAQHSNRRGNGTHNSHDLYLNSGVNLYGWRLRSQQALRENRQGELRWTRTNTYAQRDLPARWGTLTLGETFTQGEVFRSLPFKGVKLASDTEMLPDAMQNYAPVLRGVAQTYAKLEVLQNGYPLYSTFVAPGPYEIDDLAVGASSGELEVVLTEADGQVRNFIQPYSTLGNLMRAGVWRYDLALGRYHGAYEADTPALWQGTLARGMGWESTLYAGVLGGDYYRAATLGLARDFGAFGALSLDATQATSDLGPALGQVQGNSFSARYGKAFDSGTNLRFAGYRYSTVGYRDYDEVVQQRNASDHYLGNRRSRLEASVYQHFGSAGSLSLTLSQDDYWHNSLQRRQYQAQYNTQLPHNISLNLFASQSLNSSRHNDRIIGLSLSLPLDFKHASSATFDMQHSAGKHSERASLSGHFDDRRLNYRATLANDTQQSGSLSLAYQGSHANYGMGYSESADYRNLSLSSSGALLAHGGGMLLAPFMGETNAVVHVPGIEGVGVGQAQQGKTNPAGYALAPYMRPYRANQLVLQLDQLDPEIEIDNGTTQVVPRRGAVVLAKFPARRVNRLVLTLLQADDRPLPFGAQVSDAQGQVLAVVGQGGQALVATHLEQQQLLARWTAGSEQQCRFDITPATLPLEQGYRLQTLRCEASSDWNRQ
ncbi:MULTISPECIES: fimbria/pilus outer membrane usher protein [Pseudomonas]|jgi:outer membrane usher protein|uniref:fimbria/pilus outer membrane usher protein n=1 Tax=Pseudomonas TaxID=286 RepID=UPI0021F84189|nr:fimbria/pilus outer membrane usher protein [Pseudomonas putida]